MNDRNLHKILTALIAFGFGLVLCESAGAQDEDGEYQPRIVCDGVQISIDADDILPEQLFVELGRQCNIKVVAHGDVFPDQKVTVQFKDMPVHDAVRRLVKACSMRNYLMDFQKESSGRTVLSKIDIFIGGSGTRILSRPANQAQEASVSESTAVDPDEGVNVHEMRAMMQRRSFKDDTDFMWDGSAPIAFPQFTGELDYSKSQYGWNDSAKAFAEKTMDLVPPSVRDSVSELIVKGSDEVARERGAESITPEITAEALKKIGKSFHLPPEVMRNMPANMDDFEKQRIPLDPSELKEEYRE